MTTYTFDVFSSLDGFGAASGNWTGYWGKQVPSCSIAVSPSTARSSGWSWAPTPIVFARLLASSTEESVRDPWVTRMRTCPQRCCRPRWWGHSTGRTRLS